MTGTQTPARTPSEPIPFPPQDSKRKGDRWGVILSVLCAIHCAATPPLLLAAPAFGKVWAHPASHWLVALFVIPLAVVMVTRGFRRHQRKWVVASAMVGILLILAGAAAPSFAESSGQPETELAAPAGQEEQPEFECEMAAAAAALLAEDDSGDTELVSTSAETTAAEAADEECDACCPSLQVTEDGGWKLHVPLASVLTTLGGFFLIVTHAGNLCRCPSCKCKTKP